MSNYAMNLTRPTLLTRLMLAVLLCALVALVHAQESTAPGTESDSQTEGSQGEDPSRETDISEDNYRRYMELRDPRLERPPFPATVYQPPSSLQKMAQLPESSQKHLRNQLRGIILQSGPWSPDELQKPYRFTPSAAAREDGELLRAELEAWAELVGEYHAREAQSLAARSGLSPAQLLGQGAAGTEGQAGAEAQAPQMSGQTAQEQQTGQQDGQAMQQAQQGGAPQEQNGPAAGQQVAGQQAAGEQGAGEQGDGEQAAGGGESARTAAESERNRTRPRPAPGDWNDMDGTSERSMSTEGVAQSAADFLQDRGVADQPPEMLERSPGEEGALQPQENGRWGAASQTTLEQWAPGINAVQPAQNDPGESALPAPESRPNPDGPAPETLTVEELRGIRGVVDGTEDTPNWPEPLPEALQGGQAPAPAPSAPEEKPEPPEQP